MASKAELRQWRRSHAKARRTARWLVCIFRTRELALAHAQERVHMAWESDDAAGMDQWRLVIEALNA